MTVPTPELTQVGDSMTFTWPGGIEIQLERFYDSRGDITAEATVHNIAPPNAGLLHHARLNLMSTQAKSGLAKQLHSRIDDVDWQVIIEQLCYLAVDRYRSGDDPIDLRSVDPYAKPAWALYPYLETAGCSIIYGEGMVGKSVLALWMGVQAVLGGRDHRNQVTPSREVLYLDWETCAESHAARLAAICAGMGIERDAMPPMHYRKMTGSLPQSVDAVHKWIHKDQIGMVIVDSLGMAGDGPPEEAATALSLARAINGLDVPVLAIHHKRKSANGVKGENQRDRLFGSVYYANFARMVWELDGDKDEESQYTEVALVNIKRNNGPLLKRHALRVEFVNEDDQLKTVTIRKVDITTVPSLANKVGLRDRILAELKSGAGSYITIADSLGVDSVQVRARISELKRTGVVIRVGEDKWGLASNERAPF